MKAPSSRVIWDLPTRLLHWVLALCVVLNLFFLEEGDEVHRWIGYTAVASVVLRFLWGFIGGTASRWSSFVFSPKKIFAFIPKLISGNTADYEGHHPLAWLVYAAIWLLILSLGVTGWMMGLDAYWGEDWLEELHGNISLALQFLIFIHLAGITLDSIRYRRRTWMSMFTGKK